jgi:hypothetical protein
VSRPSLGAMNSPGACLRRGARSANWPRSGTRRFSRRSQGRRTRPGTSSAFAGEVAKRRTGPRTSRLSRRSRARRNSPRDKQGLRRRSREATDQSLEPAESGGNELAPGRAGLRRGKSRSDGLVPGPVAPAGGVLGQRTRPGPSRAFAGGVAKRRTGPRTSCSRRWSQGARTRPGTSTAFAGEAVEREVAPRQDQSLRGGPGTNLPRPGMPSSRRSGRASLRSENSDGSPRLLRAVILRACRPADPGSRTGTLHQLLGVPEFPVRDVTEFAACVSCVSLWPDFFHHLTKKAKRGNANLLAAVSMMLI